MKSLKFTYLKELLLDGSKTTTIRCLFIPNFGEDEIIAIKFQDEVLFPAEVVSVVPKRLSEITDEDAIKDGFKNREEAMKKIMALNKIKDKQRFCFIITFMRVDMRDLKGSLDHFFIEKYKNKG